MLSLSVNTNIAAQLAKYDALKPDQIRQAVSRSLNTTIKGIRTDVGSKVAKKYNVKAREIKERGIALRFATPARLRADAKVTGTRLRVMAFAARKVAAGVSVAIRKGKRKVIKGAFIARMPSGHTGVFRRSGYERGAKHGQMMKGRPGREAIFERYARSVPEMLRAKDIEAAMRQAALGRFDKAIARNIKFKAYGGR